MPPKPKSTSTPGTTRRTTKKAASTPIQEIQEIVHAKSPVIIDYPQAGEPVLPGHYSIRITASEAAKAEISLDNSPWQPCRQDSGYWWYDWTGFEPGIHQARVQVIGDNGAILAVATRQITVKKP